MKTLLILIALAAAAAAPAQENACSITGEVLSIQAETKAAPADRQIRMRITDAPEPYLIGASTPVTLKRKRSAAIRVGATVTLACDPADFTRRGRLYAWETAEVKLAGFPTRWEIAIGLALLGFVVWNAVAYLIGRRENQRECDALRQAIRRREEAKSGRETESPGDFYDDFAKRMCIGKTCTWLNHTPECTAEFWRRFHAQAATMRPRESSTETKEVK